jgi:DNA-binding HxlR family transcriptional regulator
MTTMSAQQRREQDRLVYDAMLAACPTRNVMSTIGNKWTALLVHALADGPRRHGQLRSAVAGISQKMLTQTLRELERDGLVTREVTASVPVRVDYALTPLGRSLVPVLRALKDWSETHIEEIFTARDEFDARDASRSA